MEEESVTPARRLERSFYLNTNAVEIARNLLGKVIYSSVDKIITGGVIVETEAYKGPEDVGSHSYNGKRTVRNEMMYAEGGLVYMYICYGIHNMLNIVTGPEGSSHAVLIRALEPVTGIDVMRQRRSVFDNDKRLCKGPGALCKAMGLSKKHNGVSLAGDTVWIEDRGTVLTDDEIIASPRVGLNITGPYRDIPWRFYIKRNPYISRP